MKTFAQAGGWQVLVVGTVCPPRPACLKSPKGDWQPTEHTHQL